MGSSEWQYVEQYFTDAESSFARLQLRILKAGTYLWPWEHVDPDFADRLLPRPSTLDELALAKQYDDFWAFGTHSILDMNELAAEPVSTIGLVAALDCDEMMNAFGTSKPSLGEFQRVANLSGGLATFVSDGWSGRYMTIFTDDVPTEICFWGCSGD